ncbi:MAG: LPS assembly lipoprotein LptE [Rhodospirillales bacterium]
MTLAACGFAPLHGRTESGVSTRDTLPAVKIEIIRDRSGQFLRNLLMDKFAPRGRKGPAQWTLSVNVTESIQSLGFRRTAEATRANLWFKGSFTLKPAGLSAAERKTFTGDLRSVSSFDLQIRSRSAEFGSLRAKKDARERALRQMADDIALRVSIILRREARDGGA